MRFMIFLMVQMILICGMMFNTFKSESLFIEKDSTSSSSRIEQNINSNLKEFELGLNPDSLIVIP